MTDEGVQRPREKSEKDGTKNGNPFWKIDRKMLPYKIHFFLFIGAMGALLPFHPSIGITRLGLGAGNLAVVFTVQQFLFVVFKPLIGYITDYFNNIKTMIVTLTVINGILSYLLLVIPEVGNTSFSGLTEYSRLQSAETNFCNFCYASDQLQKTIDSLPTMNGIFNELSCKKKNLVREVFVNHCLKRHASTSVSYNVTYKVVFETCYLSYSKLMEKTENNADSNSHNISEYKIYIALTQNRILPQFCVMCIKKENLKRIENLNFTLQYIAKSCYAYPLQKFSEISVPSTTESNFSNDIVCINSAVQKRYIKRENIESNSFKTYQFWLYTLFLITSCACTSSIFTLSDTACYESVQETDSDYGKQRAWGAIGWGLMAPFAGFLNDYTDSYLAAMILMTLLCALQIWNLSKMDLMKPQLSQNILKDIKTVLSSAEFIAFEVGVFFNGMGIGIVWFYLAWFITDIGGSRLLIGLAHTIQCFLGEMPFMLLSGWLLKRFGHFNVLSMALFAHCVRFLAYSSLNNPWLILPIECLDGISFGAFYSAMTSYGKLNSKPGTESTTQSLLCSTYEGLGAGLGCVIAGVCFDYYGAYQTFFYAGICFAVAAAINVASTIMLRFRRGLVQISKENSRDNLRY